MIAVDSEFGNAVIVAVKSAIAESPRFVRYQNEIASSLAGVAASSANTRGIALLRSLLATAPPLDAPIIFLPQQRTMFLIQKIQTWVNSEKDLGTGVQALLAELFLHLAPIVQELSGSHWDLFFDVIEFNLEVSPYSISQYSRADRVETDVGLGRGCNATSAVQLVSITRSDQGFSCIECRITIDGQISN